MDGGCACGQIRYRLSSAPFFVNCCHCHDCQKLGGSAFAVNAMIEATRLTVIAGQPVTERGETRCPDCATLLWAKHRMFGDAVLFLRAGTLDEGQLLTPDAHFFVRSKHDWIALPEGVRTFDALPGADDAPLMAGEAKARLEAALGHA